MLETHQNASDCRSRVLLLYSSHHLAFLPHSKKISVVRAKEALLHKQIGMKYSEHVISEFNSPTRLVKSIEHKLDWE